MTDPIDPALIERVRAKERYWRAEGQYGAVAEAVGDTCTAEYSASANSTADLLTEAADLIERLVAEREGVRAEAIEQCARVAEHLGGDRIERGRSYADDKHGRSDMVINAQRVRAQSIAAAIRSLTSLDQGRAG